MAAVKLGISGGAHSLELREWYVGHGRAIWTRNGVALPVSQWGDLLPVLENMALQTSKPSAEPLLNHASVSPTVRLQAVEQRDTYKIEVRVWEADGRSYRPTKEAIALTPNVWEQLLPMIRLAVAEIKQRMSESSPR